MWGAYVGVDSGGIHGRLWEICPIDLLQYGYKLNMKTCTFVTGNPNKIIEVNAILGGSIPVQPLALDIPEIQGTLEEIAIDKCRRAAQMVGPVMSTPAMAEAC